jgi:hypothetical protein
MNNTIIKFPLNPIRVVSNWVVENRSENAICPVLDQEIQVAAQKRFENHINEAADWFSATKPDLKLKPVETLPPFFCQLINKLDQYVNRILLLRPDHPHLSEEWNAFLVEFAYFRYTGGSDISSKLSDFLELLKNELIILNETFDQGLFQSALSLIKKDHDLLDIPTAYFLQKERISQPAPVCQIQLIESLEFYEHNMRVLIQRLPGVTDYIINLLKPFTARPWSYQFNFSKDLITLIENYKKNFPELLQLNTIPPDNFDNFIISFARQVDRSFEIENGGGSIPPGTRTFRNFTPFINTVEALKFTLEKYKIPEYLPICLEKFYGKPIHVNENENAVLFSGPSEPPIREASIADLKQGLEFLNAAQKAHVIWDTYISGRFSQLNQLLYAIKNWRKVHTKTYQGILERVEKERHLPSLSYNPDVADELMAEAAAAEAPKTKPNRRKKVSASSSSAKPKNPAPPAAPKRKARAKIAKQPLHAALTKIEIESLQKVLHVLNQSPSPSLKQARVHLLDLIGYLSQKGAPTGIYEVFSVMSACYYFIEQLLSEFSGTKGHNLVYLHRSLASAPQSHSIIDEMSLANFWTSFPFEQENAFQDAEMSLPPLLNELKKLILNGETEGWSDRLVDLIRKSSEYAEALLKSDSTAAPLPAASFAVNQSFEICEYVSLQGRVTKLNYQARNPVGAFVHQGALASRLAQEALLKLCGPSITHLEFPQLVRQSLFWSHRLVESLLKAAIYRREGVKPEGHDLKSLALRFGITGTRLGELDDYLSIYNAQRYPYQNYESSTATKLILQAEQLRDSPEIAQGFSKVGDKEGALLSPQEIVQQVFSLCTRLNQVAHHILDQRAF